MNFLSYAAPNERDKYKKWAEMYSHAKDDVMRRQSTKEQSTHVWH
mgnify:CR=1 FL=1